MTAHSFSHYSIILRHALRDSHAISHATTYFLYMHDDIHLIHISLYFHDFIFMRSCAIHRIILFAFYLRSQDFCTFQALLEPSITFQHIPQDHMTTFRSSGLLVKCADSHGPDPHPSDSSHLLCLLILQSFPYPGRSYLAILCSDPHERLSIPLLFMTKPEF